MDFDSVVGISESIIRYLTMIFAMRQTFTCYSMMEKFRRVEMFVLCTAHREKNVLGGEIKKKKKPNSNISIVGKRFANGLKMAAAINTSLSEECAFALCLHHEIIIHFVSMFHNHR